MISSPTITRFSTLQKYDDIFKSMREYTLSRSLSTPDALWFLEHFPVFTQGQAGKSEHLKDPQSIPVIQSDRGGQITYHGPGQLMIYTLIDLKRLSLGIKSFITHLEQSVLTLLNHYGITGHTQENAPGVYIQGKKICSLGLRVRHSRTYHGLSFNVNMDLTPFSQINPCGISQLKMTQLSEFIPEITLDNVINDILPIIISKFVLSEKKNEQ